jgi:hypothetical protein
MSTQAVARPSFRTDAPTTAAASSIEAVTRRDLLSSAVVAALLAACSRLEDAAPKEVPTRTVASVMGAIRVPIEPKRIVAADHTAPLQVLDELGAPLVAAQSRGDGQRSNVSDAAKKLPSVGNRPEIDVEAVVAARPDLIVGISGIEPELYRRLSVIAPTFLVDTVLPWRDQHRMVADAVNRRDASLRVPSAALERHLAEDAGFAARFYRAIATVLSGRLRELNARATAASASSRDELDAGGDVDAAVLANVHLAGVRFDHILKRLAGR